MLRFGCSHILLACLAVGLLGWTGPAAAAEIPRPTPADKSKAGELWTAFRTATEPAARAAVVAEALAASAAARQHFPADVESSFLLKLLAYGQALESEGRKSLVPPAADRMQQLTRQQAELHALATQGGLTKENIEQAVVPALANLRSTFIPSVATLQQVAAVAALAAELNEWGGYLAQLRAPPEAVSSEKTVPQPWTPGEQIELIERTFTLLCLPLGTGDRQTLIENARQAGQIDPEEFRALEEANITRVLAGVPPVAIDVALCQAGRDHSHAMRTMNFFSHQSPIRGSEGFGDRARNAGTSAGAENIFVTGGDRGRGESAHQAWLHSPGHLANILGGHRRAGVGRSGGHFTQMFGG